MITPTATTSGEAEGVTLGAASSDTPQWNHLCCDSLHSRLEPARLCMEHAHVAGRAASSVCPSRDPPRLRPLRSRSDVKTYELATRAVRCGVYAADLCVAAQPSVERSLMRTKHACVF